MQVLTNLMDMKKLKQTLDNDNSIGEEYSVCFMHAACILVPLR